MWLRQEENRKSIKTKRKQKKGKKKTEKEEKIVSILGWHDCIYKTSKNKQIN